MNLLIVKTSNGRRSVINSSIHSAFDTQVEYEDQEDQHTNIVTTVLIPTFDNGVLTASLGIPING